MQKVADLTRGWIRTMWATRCYMLVKKNSSAESRWRTERLICILNGIQPVGDPNISNVMVIHGRRCVIKTLMVIPYWTEDPSRSIIRNNGHCILGPVWSGSLDISYPRFSLSQLSISLPQSGCWSTLQLREARGKIWVTPANQKWEML